MLKKIKIELKKYANKERAAFNARYFKTGKGEYGEGDQFIGLTVPEMRKIAKQYELLKIKEIVTLLSSSIHEERVIALMILSLQFKKGNEKERKIIHNLYLQYKKYVNNWDLIDGSAPQIMGEYLYKRNKDILITLAKSENIWDKRIAVLSTLYEIKKGKCTNALKIAKILLNDSHDLIHKAVGWMLREIGNYCGMEKEEVFLKKHYRKMPRTMLRYSIEKFPEEKRKAYLKGKI